MPHPSRPARRPSSARRSSFPLRVEPLEDRKLLANFTVGNTNDSGPGSLRQAILDSDTVAGGNRITFAIPNPGVHTIRPLSPLPTVTNPVTIDGTQPGSSGTPLIELDGSAAGSGVIGLTIRCDGNTVRGLVINRFSGAALDIFSSVNVVAGNYLGTDPTGTVALANGGDGIRIVSTAARNNRIGGTTAADRNLISGNVGNGVIGFNAGITVEGNYIGTDVTGTKALGNGGFGVWFWKGGPNVIGGTAPGAGNLISGNNWGVLLSTGTTGNLIAGNFIGTDVTGTHELANAGYGVAINSGSHDNTVGGTAPAARNVISGNTFEGVAMYDPGTSGNDVLGNNIGLDVSGFGRLGNHSNGVTIFKGASNNTIGGSAPGSRNLLSGNSGGGVYIGDAGSSGNAVQGNYIGIDASGAAWQANYGSGVIVGAGASNNLVGGTTAGAGNVISDNNLDGVGLAGAGNTGNVVQGNFIGTDASGTRALGNGLSGLSITAGASGDTVGGSAPGARNVISGNKGVGVLITDPGSSGNTVLGNEIGTDASGLAALGNGSEGVLIRLGAANNTVGGTPAGARNVVSGNGGNGINISGVGTSGNLVVGNFAGTDVNGVAALGNTWSGVNSNSGAANNTVGGTSPGARNLLSGNHWDGIEIGLVGSSGNTVQGNSAGTDVTGTRALANARAGVGVWGGATGNLIGGTAPGAGNLLSGNNDGIVFNDAGTSSNLVQGNKIGTDAGGLRPLPNSGNGVLIVATASNNTIGGTSPAARNVISGNGGNGVTLSDPGTTGNLVQGNAIGSDATGAFPAPNGGVGVAILGASNNSVGGTTAGAGNVIAFNRAAGVAVVAAPGTTTVFATGDAILGNAIFSNAGLGIDLGPAGVTPNTPGGPHAGANGAQNFPVLSQATTSGSTTTVQGTLNAAPNAAFRVEFFAGGTQDPSGYGQGQNDLGFVTVTTDAGGNASFSFAATPAVPAGAFVSATATDPRNNTSEFSRVVVNTAPNVQKTNPTLTWPTPADIVYGTPLGVTQLDATASVPGTFAYSPAAGTVFHIGLGQPLRVTFTPNDTADYNPVSGSTTVNVFKAHLTVTADPKSMAAGAPVPSLSARLTGFVNGDTIASVGGSPSLNTTATPASAPGVYPITIGLGSLRAADYDFPALVNATLTVSGKAPSSVFLLGVDGQAETRATDASGNPTGDFSPIAPGQVKDLAAIRLGGGPGFEAFVIGTDDRVYAATIVSGVTRGYFPTAYGAIASVSAGADAAGNPLLFAVGTDHQLYEQKFDASGNPTSPGYTKAAYGDFKQTILTQNASGSPLLFAVGQDDQIYGLRMDPTGAPAGGLFKVDYGAVRQLAVGRDASNNPEVFVVGTDAAVYAHRLYASGLPVGNYLGLGGVVKSITVTNDANNNPEVFAVGGDDQVYGHRLDPAGRPTGVYFGLGTVAGGALAVVSGRASDDSPQVFALAGSDRQVYVAPFDLTGGPAGPFGLTGRGKATKVVVA